MIRLKLSRNNLSFVCYISFHSLKELARLPFASYALALAHPLPPAPFFRRAKRDCKNTPFLLRDNTTNQLFWKNFLLAVYQCVTYLFGRIFTQKRPFPGAFSADPDPVTLHFSEFFGDEGRKTFNIGLWRTGGRGQGSEDAIKRWRDERWRRNNSPSM